jgi:hypothetical protein
LLFKGNLTFKSKVNNNYISIFFKRNPDVQKFALDANLLHLLINQIELVLSKSFEDISINDLDVYHTFTTKLIFTLSTLLRNNDQAQRYFIQQLDGIELFGKILNKTQQSGFSLNSQVKIITVMNDLILENKDDENSELISNLLSINWCFNFEKLLKKVEDNLSREKILESMINVIEHCKNEFSNNNSLIKLLINQRDDYKMLINDDNSNDNFNDYLKEIIESINYILNSTNINKNYNNNKIDL